MEKVTNMIIIAILCLFRVENSYVVTMKIYHEDLLARNTRLEDL